MNIEQQVKEVLGEEFDVRFTGETMDVEIRLRLSEVVIVNAALLKSNPSHEIIRLERDRILINFKRKLTALLWKYLGDVGEDYPLALKKGERNDN